MYLHNLSRAFLFLIFSFFLFARPIFAAAPQVIAFPSGVLAPDQSFTVSATMSGLSKTALYRLRIVLALPTTSNYFGSTYNGTNWYNGTPSPINYANFLSITTDGFGAWWGDIQGKIDSDDPNFTTGSGTYDLKVGRYTQTGSTATWSDPVSITVSIPPQPTDTPTPIPTATPTPIRLARDSVITPTVKPTSTPVPSILLSPVLKPTDNSSFGAVFGTMSATSSVTENQPTLVAGASEQKKTELNFLPLIFIIGGFCLLGSCGILIALQTEKGRILWKRFF